MHALYSLLYAIALIFILPFEYFKRPRDVRKRWLKEKCGRYPATIPRSQTVIWVHAVSVGEVMAALPLLRKMKEAYPSKRIVFSTITDTGQKVARDNVPEGIHVVYLPFDVPFILASVARKMKPELLVIIETELWPNLIRVFRDNGVPVVLLNGRISEQSMRGYRRVSFFMKSVLEAIDVFGMQSEEYAERLKYIGADVRKIEVTGSFKFDAEPAHTSLPWLRSVAGPVVVAGSTHEGEEELMVSAYRDLLREFPELNLVIAPRHPDRCGRVQEMLRDRGMRYVKRSALTEGQKTECIRGTIILLDTVGELPSVYESASVAIIGKSFRGYGGQNPLEPAYWGIPVICGPHMENFPVIEDFYRAGGAIRINEEGIAKAVRELLRSPERAKEIGANARNVYRQHRGAVTRAMRIVERYVGAGS